jgi:hypothetical protein
MDENLSNIEQMVASVSPVETLLDLGRHDGANTVRFAGAARASEVHGVEIVEGPARVARNRGIRVTVSDLNRGIRVTVSDLNESVPYGDPIFDVAVNQMIVHVSDTDRSSERSAEC